MQPAAGAFSNPLLSGASPVPTTVANPVDCPQSHRFCAVLLLGLFGLTPAGPGDFSQCLVGASPSAGSRVWGSLRALPGSA